MEAIYTDTDSSLITVNKKLKDMIEQINTMNKLIKEMIAI